MNIPAAIIVSILLGAILPTKSIAQDSTYFHGTVIYTVTSHGDPSELSTQLAQALAPISHTVTFGSERRIRLIDQEGLSGANMLINLKDSLYYQLDRDTHKALKLRRDDYEEYFAPTVLKPMKESETIDGYSCRKYQLVSSQFMHRGATGYAWVTNEVKLLHERGDYNHEETYFRGLFPLPIVLGVTEGTVMKLELTENDVTVTYVADLQPGEPGDNVFVIPEGYTVEE